MLSLPNAVGMEYVCGVCIWNVRVHVWRVYVYVVCVECVCVCGVRVWSVYVYVCVCVCVQFSYQLREAATHVPYLTACISLTSCTLQQTPIASTSFYFHLMHTYVISQSANKSQSEQ